MLPVCNNLHDLLNQDYILNAKCGSDRRCKCCNPSLTQAKLRAVSASAVMYKAQMSCYKTKQKKDTLRMQTYRRWRRWRWCCPALSRCEEWRCTCRHRSSRHACRSTLPGHPACPSWSGRLGGLSGHPEDERKWVLPSRDPSTFPVERKLWTLLWKHISVPIPHFTCFVFVSCDPN